MRKYVLPRTKLELLLTEIKKYDESNTGIVYAREAKLIFKKLNVSIAVTKDKYIGSEILHLLEEHHVCSINVGQGAKEKRSASNIQCDNFIRETDTKIRCN
jgi:hypothetical protein